MTASLVVIRGLPGSGKSTAAQRFIKAGYTHIEGDMFHTDPYTGEYNFVYVRKAAAFNWIVETTVNLLHSGQDVVIAGIFPTNETLQFLKNKAVAIGADFTVLTAEANHGNIHGVPEDVLKGMAEVWEPLDLK